MVNLTGGYLNGKKFIDKEDASNKKKLLKKSLKDFDYETLFANTAKKVGLELEDKSEKQKEVLKLLEELKECEEYLLKNLSDIRIESGNEEGENEISEEKSLSKLNSDRMTLEKLKGENNLELITKPIQSINKNSHLELVNSIVNATPASNRLDKPISRIEDISPMDFKRDLLQTTDWHLYYTKLSALSMFVREKTYWPYFNQVFMISARMNEGVQDLKRYLFTRARPGNWIFNRNFLTDQMPQEIAEMCVREKLLEHLPDEVPYLLHLETAFWEVDEKDCLNIAINILPGPKSWNFKRHLVIFFIKIFLNCFKSFLFRI